MSDILEQQLRADLASLAARTPEAPSLARVAIERARVQRRRRSMWVTSGALVVVLALAGAALLVARGPASSVPPATSAPAPEPSADGVVLNGKLSYRGATVSVPEQWLDPDNVRCGLEPARDAAYVRDSSSPLNRCQYVDPPDPATLTEVVLAPWDFRWSDDVPATGGRVLADGRTQLVTRVPAADLRLIVTSPDPKLAHRIFDSLVVQPLAPCEDVWLASSDGATVHVDRDRTVALTVRVGDTITTHTNGRCDNMETTPQTVDDRVLTGKLAPPPDDYTRPLVLTATGPGTVRVTAATGQCDQLPEHSACIGGIAVLGSVDITVVRHD
jgi:hypothetical protein